MSTSIEADLRPLLVGELNPYQSVEDSRYALYPYPDRSAGGRLCRLVMGLLHRYIRAYARANLCSGKWSLPVARVRAGQLADAHPDVPIVLFGSKSVLGLRSRVRPVHLRRPVRAAPAPERPVSGVERVWRVRAGSRGAEGGRGDGDARGFRDHELFQEVVQRRPTARRRMIYMKLFWLDLETTSLDPLTGSDPGVGRGGGRLGDPFEDSDRSSTGCSGSGRRPTGYRIRSSSTCTRRAACWRSAPSRR